jgi:hypothetical protein
MCSGISNIEKVHVSFSFFLAFLLIFFSSMCARNRRSGIGYCAYCNRLQKLTRDHVIPRSRTPKTSLGLGMGMGPSPILLVCASCNRSKDNLLLSEWLLQLPSSFPQHSFARRFISMSRADITTYRNSQRKICLNISRIMSSRSRVKVVHKSYSHSSIEMDANGRPWNSYGKLLMEDLDLGTRI